MLSTGGGGAGGWQNIRNLQKEREYLRQRQQEIQNQVGFEIQLILELVLIRNFLLSSGSIDTAIATDNGTEHGPIPIGHYGPHAPGIG